MILEGIPHHTCSQSHNYYHPPIPVKNEASRSSKATKLCCISCSPYWVEYCVLEATETVLIFLPVVMHGHWGTTTGLNTEAWGRLAPDSPRGSEMSDAYQQTQLQVLHVQDSASRLCWWMKWTTQIFSLCQDVLRVLSAAAVGSSHYWGSQNVKVKWKSMYPTSHT